MGIKFEEVAKNFYPERGLKKAISVQAEVDINRILNALISGHKDVQFLEMLIEAMIRDNFVLLRREQSETLPSERLLSDYKRREIAYSAIKDILIDLKGEVL